MTIFKGVFLTNCCTTLLLGIILQHLNREYKKNYDLQIYVSTKISALFFETTVHI
jgi:hypothetical protein